jgi:hypothetical protein
VTALSRNTAPTGGSGLTFDGLNFDFQDYTTTAGAGDAGCITTSWTSITSAFCVGALAMQARLFAKLLRLADDDMPESTGSVTLRCDHCGK